MTGSSRHPGLSADTMAGIRTVFFQECDEHLAELEQGLLRLKDGERDWEIVNTVFRAVHSVKGGASIFGLEGLIAFAHQFESVLARIRAHEIEAEGEIVKVLLSASDVLADMVRAAREERDFLDPRIGPTITKLSAYLAEEEAIEEEDDVFPELEFTPVSVDFEPIVRAEGERRLVIDFRPHRELYAKANDPIVLIRELARLGRIETTLDANTVPLLDELDPEQSYLSWRIELTTAHEAEALREVFEFVEGDCELDIAAYAAEPSAAPVLPEAPVAEEVAEEAPPAVPAATVAPPATPTIRVDLDRVDRMIDLVSELVINQSILVQRLAGEKLENQTEVSGVIDDLDKLTREIQDSVMAIRAQPVRSVFQRMARLVREVEAVTGKEVQLVTDGDATEVDRTVIERISDPLTHMIRNAIDHGIETPEDRVAKGKPSQGTVRIAAAHRGGRIVIEVCDDGAGLNRERVRAKAIEKGLIASDAKLTDEETDNLIFSPGFSTAEQVSDLSGRGVGMDVVRSSVHALGGRISVSSVEGKGSTFTLSLPLTLAVMDGMLVQIGKQSFVVPLTTLIESFQVHAGDIRRLGPSSAVLTIRGAPVPLLDLGGALGMEREAVTDLRRVALLVEDDAGTRAALLVDDILGQQQVVIKSLESNYRQVRGIAAATILGDGRVALILDVSGILAAHRRSLVPGTRGEAA